MQFWPPDDEHMCSKYVEAWNKLIAKQTNIYTYTYIHTYTHGIITPKGVMIPEAV